ncbi:hypothetical protein BJ508DRAFT_73504 [Ascobolus immersus RN42]|uniref:Uncharacterized protein n=1 Tax=Ascobolus immersus RN42 TaxID=1160509 RepID=A0A3N4HDW6_ASCIM|nr:hypothetical protein BJ508DRAFT_73504 [Ascobolus immersus RN42]
MEEEAAGLKICCRGMLWRKEDGWTIKRHHHESPSAPIIVRQTHHPTHPLYSPTTGISTLSPRSPELILHGPIGISLHQSFNQNQLYHLPQGLLYADQSSSIEHPDPSPQATSMGLWLFRFRSGNVEHTLGR